MDTGIDITLGYILGKTLSYYTKQWIKTSNIHNTIYIPNFENLKFLLTYTIDRIKIIDKKLQSRLWSLHSNEPSYSTIIKPIIKFDQRNNQIYPSKGYIFELQSEFASPIFGSKLFANYENRYLHNLYNTIDRNFLKSTIFTNHFFRINATIKFYFNIHPLMIKLNIKAGYLNTFGNDLIFENYFIGGYNSIRGYSWKSIGEMHKITSVDNKIISKFTIGGNKKFIINLELEFPIIKNLKITGVIFLDLGNIYDKLHHFFFLGSNICSNKNIKDPLKIYQILGLYASSGIGIRWQTPIGVLRFECATPMTPRIENIITGSNADECFLFHVNLGHYF
jgi:outer membrane protein insertion porin family